MHLLSGHVTLLPVIPAGLLAQLLPAWHWAEAAATHPDGRQSVTALATHLASIRQSMC